MNYFRLKAHAKWNERATDWRNSPTIALSTRPLEQAHGIPGYACAIHRAQLIKHCLGFGCGHRAISFRPMPAGVRSALRKSNL